MWFTKKYKKEIHYLKAKNAELFAENQRLELLEARYNNLRLTNKDSSNHSRMAELMRESLGLQVDFAAASMDKCLPPHYLEGLEEAERKNFITDMETIYSDEKFQKVVKYLINLFATNAIYKEDPKQRDNGQVAVIAFRTLLKEFDKMHIEFANYKKSDEDDFDPLAVMPSID